MPTLALLLKPLSIVQGTHFKLSSALFTVGAPDYSMRISVLGGALYQNGIELGASGSFTLAELKLGKITFLADCSSVPSFYFQASAIGFASSAEVQPILSYKAVNQAPVLSLAGLGSDEESLLNGSTIVITREMIDAADVETPGAGNLQFKITKVKGGSFLLNGFAAKSFSLADVEAASVSFKHDGKFIAPSFSLSVSDSDGKASSVKSSSISTVFFDGTQTAGAQVLDPHEIAVKAPIAITEGAILKLSASNLPILISRDLIPTLSQASLVLRVESSQHLEIYVNGKQGSQDSFTLAELKSGLVSLKHDGSQEAPILNLSLLYLNSEIDQVSVPFHFKTINDIPVINVSNFEMSVSDFMTLNQTMFNISDEETSLLNKYYMTITVLQNSGFQVFRSGQVGVKTFTLAEIENGLITIKSTSSKALLTFGLTDLFGAKSKSFSIYPDVNNKPTGSLSIIGSPSLNRVVKINNSIIDKDGIYDLQINWVDSDSQSILSSESELLISNGLRGKRIHAVATFTDGKGNTETVKSETLTTSLSSQKVLIYNTTTSPYSKYDSSIAVLADDSYVVVWESILEDGSGRGVFGQKYSQTDLPQGEAFRVNDYILSNQDQVMIRPFHDGGFITAWISQSQDGSSEKSIYAKIYDAHGATSQEIKINTHLLQPKFGIDISQASNKNVLICWGSAQDPSYGVYAQLLDLNGSKINSEFRVNETTDGNQWHPHSIKLSNDKYLVTWLSVFNSKIEIMGRMLDSTGMTEGGEFLIENLLLDPYIGASLSPLNNGGYVVTWHDYNGSSDNDIFAKIYDSENAVVVDKFRVNTNTTFSQTEPYLLSMKNGDFIIAWTSDNTTSLGDIHAQRFSSDGSLIGTESIINNPMASDFNNYQWQVFITESSFGDIIFSWTSQGSVNQIQTVKMSNFGYSGTLWQCNDGVDNVVGTDTIDTIMNVGSNDSVYGSLGNDIIEFSEISFAKIDGGIGDDTLIMTKDLDLLSLGDLKLMNIEMINLNGNMLTTNNAELLNICDSRKILTINGDSSGTLDLLDIWSTGATSAGFTTYTQGASKLIVDSDIVIV